jgi:hypothetical protein
MAGYIGRAKSGINLVTPEAVTVSATEPSSPSEGDLWYDSTTGVKVLKFYNGTAWLKVNFATPTLTSISGVIVEGTASSLTISGINFLTSNLVVNFLQASDSIDVDVTVTPTSNQSATVAVPSSVYDSVTTGNVVSITVTNSDGADSNTITKTAITLPTGGTITTSGNYKIHTFTSSGTFANSNPNFEVEYLIVAGGGSGGGGVSGSHTGGGGGAGELKEGTTTLSAQNYTITLGAGGSNGTSGRGSNGVNTTALGLTAAGGGAGGAGSGVAAGLSGGSGGGGGGVTGGAGGASTASDGGFGNAGGTGHSGLTPDYNAGGGGGAGEAGFNADGAGAEQSSGGDGRASDISGTSTYYAGGGRGSNGTGSAGLGGGGEYADGTANTGGGAGGGGSGMNGPSGGSGIVIIRYAI